MQITRATPRKLFYIYIVGTALAFLWIFVNFTLKISTRGAHFIFEQKKIMQCPLQAWSSRASWCPDDNELDLERKKVKIIEQKFEAEKQQINILKRHIDELKTELHKAESKVQQKQDLHNLPKIYIVTPTYARPEQKAELTRLLYTLRHVPQIHWIVVEDAAERTGLVTRFLAKCGLSYTHLYAITPAADKLKAKDPNWLKPRGVAQRNAGLLWIRKLAESSGVVYFADDDNTYDLQLFEEMRYTQRVSVWPVGLVGYLKYESPIVKDGKVTGWYTYWKPDRPFALDMAGFAVSISLIQNHPTVKFRSGAGRGNLESDLLTRLGVQLTDLEVRADNCTKILVWHTRTEKSSMKNEEKMLKKYGYKSNKNIEV